MTYNYKGDKDNMERSLNAIMVSINSYNLMHIQT
jgi:hypothetical protein